MNIPYNNGKIAIGKYYKKPQYIEQDADMLLIQKYLINDPVILRKQYWFNVVYKVTLLVMLLGIILNY